MRYFVPVLFLVATGWLVWHNQQGGEVLVVPFVDVLFPGTAGNPEAMATRSAQVMASLTVMLFAWNAIDHVRALRRDDRTR